MSIFIDSLVLTHKMADTFEKINEARLERDSDHLDRFFQDLSSRVERRVIFQLIVCIREIID